MNNRGQIVGTRWPEYPSAKAPRALLWENGKVTDLGPGVARDINEQGQIVGFGHLHAILWEHGKATELPELFGADYSSATAVNERGQIVGELGAYTSPTNKSTLWKHAIVWQQGTIVDLGTLGGRRAIVAAISERGQVVGWSQPKRSYDGGPFHAFVWEAGKMVDLGPYTGAGRMTAVGINERNQIIGMNGFPDLDRNRQSAKFAVVWTKR
jgi:probable HAF family extracellular repeat protein